MNGQSTKQPAHDKRAHRRDGGSAFVPDPSEDDSRTLDDLAEVLAESYVRAATSGEQQADQALDDFVDEELGGPFMQEDGDVDLPPEGFPRLPSALTHELTAEPDFLGFEPHVAQTLAKRSETSAR